MRMAMREAGAMTTFNRLFRRATLGDAAELAELVEFASEGLALCLWTQLAGRDRDPWQVGRSRVSGQAGAQPHRVRHEYGCPPALRTKRLPRSRPAQDGQAGMAASRQRVGADDKVGRGPRELRLRRS